MTLFGEHLQRGFCKIVKAAEKRKGCRLTATECKALANLNEVVSELSQHEYSDDGGTVEPHEPSQSEAFGH